MSRKLNADYGKQGIENGLAGEGSDKPVTKAKRKGFRLPPVPKCYQNYLVRTALQMPAEIRL